MRKYVVRRLVQLLPVLLGVSMLVFFGMHLIPGDVAQLLLGERGSEADLQRIRHQLGLDQPIYVQYVRFLAGVLRGDFGDSIRTRQPVIWEIGQALPVTIELSLAALAFAVMIGLGIGVMTARRPHSALDTGTMVFVLVGVSMPVFWTGILLLLVFGGILGWLPLGGVLDFGVTVRRMTGMPVTDALLAGNWPGAWNGLQHLVVQVEAMDHREGDPQILLVDGSRTLERETLDLAEVRPRGGQEHPRIVPPGQAQVNLSTRGQGGERIPQEPSDGVDSRFCIGSRDRLLLRPMTDGAQGVQVQIVVGQQARCIIPRGRPEGKPGIPAVDGEQGSESIPSLSLSLGRNEERAGGDGAEGWVEQDGEGSPGISINPAPAWAEEDGHETARQAMEEGFKSCNRGARVFPRLQPNRGFQPRPSSRIHGLPQYPAQATVPCVAEFQGLQGWRVREVPFSPLL